MSDFIKFCPKCYTLFRDADLYQQHIAQCGTIKEKEAGKQTAGNKRSQNTEVRSQEMAEEAAAISHLPETEEQRETNGAGSETPDSCLLTPDSSSTPPQRKTPKFKT
jgi:uncharacterized C2H2 Zn-finger protein